MTDVTSFLEKLDSAVQKGQFSTWDFDEDYGYVGAMQASGFVSNSGVALVFESVEYSVREGVIQSIISCHSTFPTAKRLIVGNGIRIEYDDLTDPDTGEFWVNFGNLQAISRGQLLSIPLEKTDLMSNGYLEPEAESLTPQSLVFKICDTVPNDWLFSKPDYIITSFEMPSDTKLLFCETSWQHFSIEEVYADEIKPSSSPDIVAMVEALFSGNNSPQLTGIANTSWRVQWLK